LSLPKYFLTLATILTILGSIGVFVFYYIIGQSVEEAIGMSILSYFSATSVGYIVTYLVEKRK